ncbi:MAG TPA: CHRD domain-containing protein [Actinomycetota bacterium]
MVRRSLTILTVLCVLLVGAAAPSFAGKIRGAPGGGGQWHEAELNGANEVPGPGDADGTGTAIVTLNKGRGEVCWQLNVSNITLPAAAAHIHRGEAGVPGPVVVTLSAPAADGEAIGCTSADKSLIDAIRLNPSDYYVNVHTSDFPAGAVRGQLTTG